jgi:hypothetical protein
VLDIDIWVMKRRQLRAWMWTTDFLQGVSQSPVSGRRESVDQLDRASISVLLNTAEGNGKRQGPKEPNTSMRPAVQPWKVRRAWMPPWLNESQRAIESVLAKLPARIVAMLTRFVERFDPDEFRVREDGINE